MLDLAESGDAEYVGVGNGAVFDNHIKGSCKYVCGAKMMENYEVADQFLEEGNAGKSDAFCVEEQEKRIFEGFENLKDAAIWN